MIYLLRSWPDIPPESLYSFDDQSLAFALNTDLLSATVVHTNSESRFTIGQTLTYPELLTVLLQDTHVVTL